LARKRKWKILKIDFSVDFAYFKMPFGSITYFPHVVLILFIRVPNKLRIVFVFLRIQKLGFVSEVLIFMGRVRV
jgi:hypothetical protein